MCVLLDQFGRVVFLLCQRYAHISWSFCASVRCDEARQVSGIDQQLALQLDRQRSVVEWPEVQCISALELQGHIVVDDSNARA